MISGDGSEKSATDPGNDFDKTMSDPGNDFDKPAEDPTDVFDFASEHAAILKRAFDEILTGNNRDLIPELYDDDCVGYDPANNVEVRGHEGLNALLDGYRSVFPEHRYQIHEVVAQGEFACIRWSVAPNSRLFREDFETHGLSMCRFRDGRIWQVWQHWDNLGLLQALGSVGPEINVAAALQSATGK